MSDQDGDLPPIQDVSIVDGKDWFLQSIIDTVINEGIDIGVTLTIGGTIISGMLIGGRKYFEQLGDMLADQSKDDDDITNVLGTGWKQYSEIYSKPEGTPDGWRPPAASYIHLKDAKIFMPGQKPIPTNNGFLWRGRLSSVDGFSIGNLSE